MNPGSTLSSELCTTSLGTELQGAMPTRFQAARSEAQISKNQAGIGCSRSQWMLIGRLPECETPRSGPRKRNGAPGLGRTNSRNLALLSLWCTYRWPVGEFSPVVLWDSLNALTLRQRVMV